jgi:hypothetical protein
MAFLNDITSLFRSDPLWAKEHPLPMHHELTHEEWTQLHEGKTITTNDTTPRLDLLAYLLWGIIVGTFYMTVPLIDSTPLRAIIFFPCLAGFLAVLPYCAIRYVKRQIKIVVSDHKDNRGLPILELADISPPLCWNHKD